MISNTEFDWLDAENRTNTRIDRQIDAGQSDPYVPLCFAGDTKMTILFACVQNLVFIFRGYYVSVLQKLTGYR